MNLTDGEAHEVTLYALDWDAVVGAGIQLRDERIDVIDPASNTVLATETLTSFLGEYVSFSISGSVIIRVTNLAPPGPSSSNAVVSGIFFGAAVSTPAAAVTGTDSTTLGAWRSAYGGDGYDIAQDTSGGNPVLPSYAQVTLSGASDFTWQSPSTSPYALQDADGSAALEATWYSPTSFDIDVNLTDGEAHEVTLYALDWDAVVGAGIQRRDERIDVIDPASDTVLATETLTSFLGEYVSFSISGRVIIRVTNLAPAGPSSSNAVVGGIFFGAAATTTTQLYYSAQGQVIEERQNGTAAADVTHQYVWSQAYVNALVLRDTYQDGVLVPADRLYAQQDANFDTTALVNTSGAVVERYTYTPDGVVAVLDASGTPVPGNTSAYGWQYLFQGGRLDSVTGTVHFAARDYDPTTGVWTQADPLGLGAGDLNDYRFVGGNPVNATDPSGLLGNRQLSPAEYSARGASQERWAS